MAWVTPITWTTGAVVTKANLDEQIRDNMNALSGHTHGTGAAGDGALMPPVMANDRRITWQLPTHIATTGTDLVVLANTASTVALAAWDGTNKIMMVSVTSSTGSSLVSWTAISPIGRVPTVLLPHFWCHYQHSSTATNIVRLGFSITGTALSADPTDGIYFRSTNGGNWFAVVRNASAETATDTTVAASTTTPKSFKIEVGATNSVLFYIDEVLVRTETGANIPASTTILQTGMGWAATAGSIVGLYGAYFGMSHRVKSS